MPPSIHFLSSLTHTSAFHRSPLVTRNVAARDTALSRWNSTGVQFYQSIVNDEGEFNGTCITDYPDKISVEIPPNGMCASFYSDVTSYCCAAVGGIYTEISSAEANSKSHTSTAPISMDYNEPLCETTSYSDMLSCFSYTIENDCRHRSAVSPSGLCNPQEGMKDTSNPSSSAASSRKSIGLNGLFVWGFLASIGLQALNL